MRSIVAWSMKLRVTIIAAALALLIVGIARLGDTPTNILPEFLPPTVEIQTDALGLSAAEVEQLITVPLEADLLNGLPWLDTIRSVSIPSLSSIELRFRPGTNLMAARQMVQEKLTQAHGLPNVSKPPVMLQPVSSTSRVLHIGMSSKELSLIQMSVLAHWNIRPRLMGVPGVANVSIWGQRNRQLQVLVDPERIRSEGVSLRSVIATTGNALWVSPLSFLNASAPGTGGFIDSPNQRLGVRHVLPIVSSEGLANVVIEGSTKRLGDVVDVVENHQPLIGDAIIGADTGLMLVVERLPSASVVEVTRGVEKALETMRSGLKGIEFDTTIYRPASYIERGVENLKTAMLLGGALVLLFLLRYFLSWRVALISAAAIVGSLLLAWFVLFLRGAKLDMFVFLGLAIALGAIIDDAIVDLQNVRRQLAQPRPDGATALNAMIGAAARTRGAMAFATIMMLLLVAPFFFLEGVAGSFMTSVGLSYATAVVASFVVALTLTPALCVLLLPKEQAEGRDSPAGRALAGWFESLGRRVSSWKRPAWGVYSIVAIALALSAATYPLVRTQAMLPDLRETDLMVHWAAKPGTSKPAMSRITTGVVRELRGLPGIRNVGAHVGRAVTSDQVVGVSSGELWISIDPEADYDATTQRVDAVLKNFPGMEYDITTYFEHQIERARGRDDDKVVVRVYGQDPDVLSIEGEKIKGMVSGIPGVTEIEVPRIPIEPTVEIQVDLARAKQYGIKPGDVRRASATLLSGLEVGSLFEEKKVFEVVVWGTPETRSSLSSIRNLLLQAPDGTYVRLHDVADVNIAPHPVMIKREAVARYVDVEIDVEGRALGAVAKDVGKRLANYAFPSEYHAEVLGGFSTRERIFRSTLAVVLFGVIGVLLLLHAALRSWRLSLAVLVSVPVAMLGGILLSLFTGGELPLAAYCGLILVTGLALRAATSLILHYQRLERIEGVQFGPALVAQGTLDRAGPILASLCTVTLALLPCLFFWGKAGLELIAPTAAVIVSGLITTALFALFVLPALYLKLGSGAASEEEFEDLQKGELYV
jgi:Cu/Ag efflux pump CusA